MTSSHSFRGLRRFAVLVSAAALLTACSSTPASGGTGPARGAGGTASVACAGSLIKLYEDTLGPAFERATGSSFAGPPCAGSLALASEILSGEISPGVFLSIGAKPIEKLFPAGRARFALAIASDPLVIAYSPKSRYYQQLNAIRTGEKPLGDLFGLLASAGFRLGRTDPTQDPQGFFFILMTKLAQTELHLPAGEAARALGITTSSPYGSSSQMLDESALPTDIAEGVVDAGSAFLSEAKQFGLDYITLPATLDFASPSQERLYSSVSLVIAGSAERGEVISLDAGLVSPTAGSRPAASDEAADRSFVAFLLSPAGRAILRRAGYSLTAPVLHLAPGVRSAARALPAEVLSLFRTLKGSIAPT